MEENIKSSPDPLEKKKQRSSSRRLMLSMKLYARVFTSKTDVSGQEQLEQLPPDARIIFAVAHDKDIHIPLVVAALGDTFDLAMVDMSIHRDFGAALRSLDPTIGGLFIAGRKHFLPISYKQEGWRKRKGLINSANLDTIGQVIETGKAVVIAAHNPTFNGSLPDNPGYAAVRIAQSVEGAIVIPVVVEVGKGRNRLGFGNILSMIETMIRRPSVKMSLGKPLMFNNPEVKKAIVIIEEILARRQQGKEEADDRKRMVEARKVVNAEGARLMEALAAMLSPEKRGKWGNDPSAPNIS